MIYWLHNVRILFICLNHIKQKEWNRNRKVGCKMILDHISIVVYRHVQHQTLLTLKKHLYNSEIFYRMFRKKIAYSKITPNIILSILRPCPGSLKTLRKTKLNWKKLWNLPLEVTCTFLSIWAPVQIKHKNEMKAKLKKLNKN